MKTAGIVALIFAAILSALGQEQARKSESAKPIASMAWLVGGVWTADASRLGPGMQRIETRYEWSDNNAFIRFTTHFVMDRGTAKTYDGNFFWNPEKSSMAMWYVNAENEITEGPVAIDGPTLQMSFHGSDFDGKPADLRVKVIKKTNDLYTWLLEERLPEGWKQLATLDYLRRAGS